MKAQTGSKKIKTILRWIAWVLLIQFILMNISAAFYAARLTRLHAERPYHTATPKNIFQKTWRLFTGPKMYRSAITETPNFTYTNIFLLTENNIKLHAWYAKADSVAKGTVILFHGVTSNKSAILTEANEFRYYGYNVLLLDFRGHGESGGTTTTIGVKEAEDIKLAWDFVKQQGENNIIFWGTSMGAVTICNAISKYKIEPAGIILEAPFESLQYHLKGRARTLGFPSQPFGFLVTGWIGIERGFNGYKHKTTRFAKDISCPVIVQWGAKDTYVLKKEAESIYNALASADKKLVVYEHAGHESMAQKETEKWRKEITEFLARAIR